MHGFFVSNREKLFGVLLVLMVLFPVILLVLPADYFDKGQSICLSVLLADTPCPGCGLTRATMHLIHFDVEAAMQYNKLVFIVLPLVILVYLQWMVQVAMKIKPLDQQLEASAPWLRKFGQIRI